MSNKKGFQKEEQLRSYFLDSGYFVVRGIPYIYDKYNITDIDLWLYGRSSSLSRQITIVDIKNKKTPQAIERIFWTNGLRKAVSADDAIVATSEKRQSVKDFGQEQGILVLDGYFLSKLEGRYGTQKSRLSDEQFISKIGEYSLEKLDGDWTGKITQAKSLLTNGLNYNTFNALSEIAHFFAKQIIIKSSVSEIATRCFLLVTAYLAVCVDYILKEVSFLDHKERIAILRDGFTYGSKGQKGIKNIVETSISLLENYTEKGHIISNQIRKNIFSELSELPTNIIAEYFAKNEVAGKLLTIAKDIESIAMKVDTIPFNDYPSHVKGLVLCLFDYWSIDRTRINQYSPEIRPTT